MNMYKVLFVSALAMAQISLKSQCALTASITLSGSSDICSGDSVVLSGPASGSAWSQKSNVGGSGGRDAPIGFSIGNKGYIGTGWNNGTAYNDFWEYDPSADVWTQKANVPGGGRSYAYGMSINNKGYVGGGYGQTDEFWEYDPVTNTWIQKASFTGGGIYFATAFATASKGYVCGGNGYNQGGLSNVWEYDPASDVWAAKTPVISGDLTFPSSFVINGNGYVFGGINSGGSIDKLMAYDPSTDTWTQKASIPNGGISAASGFALGNKGYMVAGNRDQAGWTNELWEYDAITNQWKKEIDFPGTKRIRGMAFSIGNYGYFGVGINENYSYNNDFYRYTAGLSYSWSTGQVSESIAVKATGNYSLAVSSIYTASCIAVASQTVGVTTTPTVSVTGANAVCAGTGATLTAGGAATYSWSANAGSATTNTVAVSPQSAELYSVIGANNQCKDTVQWYVKVNELPAITIVPNGPTEVCGTGSLTLDASNPGGAWSQKANVGGGIRANGVAFTIGTKGYIGTGYTNSGANYDFWEYDPATDVWTQKADFAGYIRNQALGFSAGGKGYIGMGVMFSMMNDFWEYDPSLNAWTQKANYPGQARTLSSTFTIGSKAYLALGYDASYTPVNEVYEYDPANDAWTQKTNFPGQARYSALAATVGNKGYICGGSVPMIGVTNEMWEYNPTNDSWTAKTSFPAGGRDALLGFSVGGKVYAGTGNNGSLHKDMWSFDPSADSWTQILDFAAGYRINAISFTIGNKAYTGTGYDQNYNRTNDFWEFDPAVSYSWSNGAATQSTSVNASGDYSVTITVGNGCSATASQQFSVIPIPSVVIAGDSAVCTGNNFTLTASGATTYTWSSNLADATTSTVNLTPSTIDTYTVTGAIGSCTNTAVKTVSVNNLPSVNAISNNTLLCAGQTATLTATGALTYTWSTNQTTAQISINPGSQTTYTVTGTDINGCTDFATVTQDVSICTGLVALQNTEAVTIYPNPGNGLFYVELISGSRVSVVNTVGQEVFTGFMNSGKNEVDIQQLANGVYYIKITQNDQQKIVKIIKQ